MVSVKEAIGINWTNVVLKDNEYSEGGVSFYKETLKDFLDSINKDENMDYGELCIELEKNGITAVRPLRYMQLPNNIKGLKISLESSDEKKIVLMNMNFKEILRNDLEYCYDIIKEGLEKGEIKWDDESTCWRINGEDFVDYLWYEQNTYLHPKEIIGYVEDLIREMREEKFRILASIEEDIMNYLIRDTLPDDELI